MELILKRIAKRPTYTIGKLYVDGQYFCDTLEDTDRGLTDQMSVQEIAKKKIKHKTAIPSGTYKVTTNIVSPKFSQKPFYYQITKGKMPRVLNVKGFDGILIHYGKNADWSSGCILVGKNTIVGQLTDGQNVFKELYKKLQGQQITLTIK